MWLVLCYAKFTAQKMKFCIKDFFIFCSVINSRQRSHWYGRLLWTIDTAVSPSKILRSSHGKHSTKNGVLRSFEKFTGWMHRKIHRKNEGLNPATLLKKRLWHRCFPVNFKKFLRTAFFIEHFWATASGFSYWLHTIRSEKWHLKYFRLNGFP